ncbi:hypothetical protein [Cellulomonas sp.]|uniref:hypothetical protein n=1 Tax=Cellulomonas sp. TaxID=40001 RepID=UPI001B2234E5|nr:hypothetical protein [Cellulomonas sp.]MBO9556639.1 hypothetical protein [Cellulomonas sp.]
MLTDGRGTGVCTLEQARGAQRRLRTRLGARDGVCGVGLVRRDAGYVLRVNVLDEDVEVPRRVDGVPVEVRVTGPLSPLGPAGRAPEPPG